MMKVHLYIFIILILVSTFSCKKNNEEIKGITLDENSVLEINKKFFLSGYTYRYESYTLDPKEDEKVIKVFNEYFKDQKYIIIFIGDINADGGDDYFAVIEYPGIYKGIKEGLIIDYNGNIEMYFDTVTGIYKNKNEIYCDLNRIGYKKGEVSCIRVLLNQDDFLYTQHDSQKVFDKYGQYKNLGVEVDGWHFQFIDKDLKVISVSSNQIFAQYDSVSILKFAKPAEYEVYFQLSMPFSEEERYEDLQFALEEYRENKKKGLVFDPINLIP